MNLMEDRLSMVSDVLKGFKNKQINNSVLILRCDVAHGLIFEKKYELDKEKPSDYFYILHENFFTTYECLMAARFSPFAKRLEEISLMIFESGIKQHWKALEQKIIKDNHHSIVPVDDKSFLKMNDLKYVFYIFGSGLMLANFVLLIEFALKKYHGHIMKQLVKKLSNKNNTNIIQVISIEP